MHAHYIDTHPLHNLGHLTRESVKFHITYCHRNRFYSLPITNSVTSVQGQLLPLHLCTQCAGSMLPEKPISRDCLEMNTCAKVVAKCHVHASGVCCGSSLEMSLLFQRRCASASEMSVFRKPSWNFEVTSSPTCLSPLLIHVISSVSGAGLQSPQLADCPFITNSNNVSVRMEYGVDCPTYS